MKKILLCILVFCSIIQLKANKRDSIELTGSIYNDEEKVKDVIIKIYDGNSLFKRIKVGSSNRFKTYLPVNKYLTIQIEAPNFHEKRFTFDTHLPEDIKKIPSYYFDMDLFKEEELEGVNPSILDFPAGLVYYDEKKKKFLHHKDYTKKMKKEYYRLLEEAKMSERAPLEESEVE
jgi:hypothetical protein